MKYNIKVGEKWLIGESATETIKGTVRGDTTAVFSRMVGEMSAYVFADHRKEAASFDRITLCDYLRGIVERQNYGHYLGEIKVIPEDEVEAQLPKKAHWVAVHNGCGVCSNCNRQDRIDSIATHCRYCGAEIIWIMSPAGKVIPCDPIEVPYWKRSKAKGKIVTKNGEVISCELYGAPETETGIGYVPHWATCPKAGEFRRKK